MLAKSVSAVAVLVFAAHVCAEEKMPYKPLMKMSVHQMFGIGRRQTGGYQPGQSICGDGTTCAEACGAGFVTCASTDSTVHCYNGAADQTCCPDNSGNSCDAGYYCALGTTGETTCCPNGVDLASCAALMSVTGSLVSETPKPTTSSTSSSSTSSSVVITTSSASANSTTFHAWNTTTTAMSTDTVTSCESTLTSSASLAGSNTTTTQKVTSVVASTTHSATPSSVSISGASTVGAAGALSLLAVAAIAALL